MGENWGNSLKNQSLKVIQKTCFKQTLKIIFKKFNSQVLRICDFLFVPAETRRKWNYKGKGKDLKEGRHFALRLWGFIQPPFLLLRFRLKWQEAGSHLLWRSEAELDLWDLLDVYEENSLQIARFQLFSHFFGRRCFQSTGQATNHLVKNTGWPGCLGYCSQAPAS